MSLDPVTALLDIGSKVIDRLWPDPAQAAAAKLELIKLQQSGELAAMAAETKLAEGQIAVNEKEAQSGSIFVSGWRPAVGWCCGLALGYSTLIEPFMRFVAVVVYGYAGSFPVIDTTLTTQVLLGLLGLAGFRSLDKIKGVASK